MRRRLVLAFLAAGAVIGYGSGFSHLHHWREHHDLWAAGRCEAMRSGEAAPFERAVGAPAPLAQPIAQPQSVQTIYVQAPAAPAAAPVVAASAPSAPAPAPMVIYLVPQAAPLAAPAPAPAAPTPPPVVR